MNDLRTDPRVRDLAILADRLANQCPKGKKAQPLSHQELRDLHERGRELVGDHKASTDLAELAARFEDTPQHRTELDRSAREILKLPKSPMRDGSRVAVGSFLIILGTAVLSVAPWAWSLATSSIGVHARGIRAHFLWLGFTPTTEFCFIIIVMLMAVIGSVAVLILAFSNRAGHQTLQQGYLWWYLTRPVAAAAIGVLFYMAVIAGFFNQASAQGRSALVLAAAIGGLAGLFTDKVLQKMRGVLLGQGRFDKPAASQDS